jgi:micrococcal nuclease
MFQRQGRRRRSRPLIGRWGSGLRAVLALIVAVGALLGYSLKSRSAAQAEDYKRFDKQSFAVVRVIDGDTLVIRAGTDEVHVRLAGIDAPEMHPKDRPRDYWADRATTYAAARTKDQSVTLQLPEIRSRDKYDRLLAYVFLPNHEMLNEALIRDGQAYVYRLASSDYQGQFEQSENAARTGKRGLWKEVTMEQMPEWRRQWMRENGIGFP